MLVVLLLVALGGPVVVLVATAGDSDVSGHKSTTGDSDAQTNLTASGDFLDGSWRPPRARGPPAPVPAPIGSGGALRVLSCAGNKPRQPVPSTLDTLPHPLPSTEVNRRQSRSR